LSRTLARLDGQEKIDVSVLNSVSLQQRRSCHFNLQCSAVAHGYTIVHAFLYAGPSAWNALSEDLCPV